MKSLNLKQIKEELNQINVDKNINNFTINHKHSEYLKKFNQRKEFNNNRTSPEKTEINNKNIRKRKINIEQDKKLISSHLSELEYLEKNFMEQFLNETKNEPEEKIRAIIPKKKQDYENRVKLVLEKAENEILNYYDYYFNMEKKNLELKNKVEIINMEKLRLYKDLKNAELSIQQINKKYELFTQLKPFYEDLRLEFKNRNKDNSREDNFILGKNNKVKKNIVNEVEKEIKEKIEKYNDFKDKVKTEEKNIKKENEQLYDYFDDLEKNNKKIEEQYRKKLSNIKEEIDNNQLVQKENQKIQNSFISVFNLLYNTLNLQRDIIENPKNINIIKTDYTPKTYILEELIRYFNLMLINISEETCGQLLRQIISYPNMMLREVVEGFDRTKYDPVKTIHEIEKYISSIDKEKKTLKKDIKNIQKENSKENDYIEKLNKEIIKINKMYVILNKTIKMIYINENNVDNKIKKSFSAENFTPLEENNNEIKNKTIEQNNKKIINIKNNLESQKNKELQFQGGIENLVNHINRLVFYQKKLNIRPKDMAIYINASKRIKDKLYRLKKFEKKKNKFRTIENALTGNINENIDHLIYKIQK